MPSKNLDEVFIKASMASIGSKVSKATELTFQAKKLNEKSDKLLFDAQTEIADLYMTLAEHFKSQG